MISSDDSWNREVKTALVRYMSEKEHPHPRIKVYEKLPSLEEAVVNYGPHLIILNFEPETASEKMHFLDYLGRLTERIPVVASAPDLSSEFMLECVKKGVRDFFRQPLQPAEIEPMMTRLLQDRSRDAENTRTAEVYTFFSYKGGIGTTFLSGNTAVALAETTGSRVLLWDMVFQNGDVPFFFDYDPASTLTDFLENLSRIDEEYIRGTLPVLKSGISILAGPKRPEEAENIRTDQIHQLHQLLRGFFDYIVIDGGHALTDPVINMMDNSKCVFLTTDLHLPVLKNTLRCIEVFERLGYVEGKYRILLNRYNSKYEKFDLGKAEEILRHPITFHFANDYVTASRSLNAGMPVAELAPKSILGEQFNKFADLALHSFEQKTYKPSMWERLFKRRSKKDKKGKKTKGRVKKDRRGGSENLSEEEEENAA